MTKVSDKVFWELLKENDGLFEQTAEAIRKRFKCDYTRQAVYDRAYKKIEQLKEILESTNDYAEGILRSLMDSKKEDMQLKAVQIWLKAKAKKRGYFEKVQTEGNINVNTGPDLSEATDKQLKELEKLYTKIEKDANDKNSA